MMSQQNRRASGAVSRRDVAFLVFKRRREIVGVFLATVVFVTIGTYVTPRAYEASATLYVVRNLPPIAATAPSTFSMILDRREVLNSEVDLITSRRIAERLAEQLSSEAPSPSSTPAVDAADDAYFVRALRSVRGSLRQTILAAGLADQPVDGREALVNALQQGIRATPGVNSDFITVTYRHENPEYAALVVNTVVNVYARERLILFKRPGVQEFYDEQITRARQTIDAVDGQIRELKARTGVVTPQDQLTLKLEELSALNSELSRVRGESRELSERVTALRARVENEPDVVMGTRLVQRNPSVVELDRKRLELESQRTLELNRFQEDSPQIKEIDLAIQRIRTAIAVEPSTVVSSESMTQNTLKTTLLTDLYRAGVDATAKLAREQALASQIAALTAAIVRLDGDAAALQRLTATAESAVDVHARYIEQQEEARIATATDPGVTNVHVVSGAATPSRPMYPRMTMITLGALLGLFVGFAFAFVSELFTQTLDRRDDVERELGVPLLASLPVLGPAYRRSN